MIVLGVGVGGRVYKISPRKRQPTKKTTEDDVEAALILGISPGGKKRAAGRVARPE